MENERTIKNLEMKNDLLNEEVNNLRELILEMKFEEVRWIFESSTVDDLTDISTCGSFPFTYEFLLDAGIELQSAMEWIRNKKKELEEESDDDTDEESDEDDPEEKVKVHIYGFVHR